MIISLTHRFVFIKTIKTAGSSIEVALSQHCEESAIVTPLYPPEPTHRPRNFEALQFEPHTPAATIRARLGAGVWDGLTKVTVERNPWDKMVSWYGWQRHLAALDCDFNSFIVRCAELRRWPYLFPASAELYSIDGVICVERAIRFERLEEDFAAVFNNGFGLGPMALPHAKIGHRPTCGDYRALYDVRARNLVAQRYAREIDSFDYRF